MTDKLACMQRHLLQPWNGNVNLSNCLPFEKHDTHTNNTISTVHPNTNFYSTPANRYKKKSAFIYSTSYLRHLSRDMLSFSMQQQHAMHTLSQPGSCLSTVAATTMVCNIYDVPGKVAQLPKCTAQQKGPGILTANCICTHYPCRDRSPEN